MLSEEVWVSFIHLIEKTMANRQYKQFKEKRIGKRTNYDNTYWYQCVDLVKLYLDECLWLGKIGSLGNAKNVPNSPLFKNWQKLTTKNLIQWDIIVRTQWEYWHIAIVDWVVGWYVVVLEQNWSWKNSWDWLGENAIRTHKYKTSWYNVVLRNEKIQENFKNEINYAENKVAIVENLIIKLKDEIKITNDYIKTLKS